MPPRGPDSAKAENATSPSLGMRMILAELEHVPTLRGPLERLMTLQRERMRLEQSRRARQDLQSHAPPIARESNSPERLRDFHNHLAQEDRVFADMREAIAELKEKSGPILEEIATRRDELHRRMDSLQEDLEAEWGEAQEPAAEATAQARAQELRALRRADRMHLLLADRIERLRERDLEPGGREAVRKFLRGGIIDMLAPQAGGGLWRGEPPYQPEEGRWRRPGPEPPDRPGRPDGPLLQKRLLRFQKEADDLRRRLKQIELEAEQLQRLADEPTTPPARQTSPLSE